MLQRKLLLVFGSLVALILVATISAIGLLHNVLEDLLQASRTAAMGTTTTHALEHAALAVGVELDTARRDPATSAPAIAARVERLELERASFVIDELPEAVSASVERLDELIGLLRLRVARLDETPDAAGVDAALTAAEQVLAETTTLGALVREQGRIQLDQLVAKFRIAGLVVGIVSLVLLNVSIIVILRATTMVLRPVDQLVEASRRLGREEFDHRVPVERQDEFGELALAYNRLAEQLETNEQRKVETLHQVARTLSHELNNAISTIEMQLALVSRRSDSDALAEPLQRIHQSLARMSRIVDAVLHVRRIVLTDYLAGVKMLDLERSVREDGGQPPPASAVAEMKSS